MIRIAGTEIPEHKHINVALTYIYGIGQTQALKILSGLKIDPATKAKDLPETQINAMRKMIEAMPVEGTLRQLVRANLDRLKHIKSYRGIRHERKLPVRGQRTKTNSRSVRGNVRLTASGTSSKKSQPSPT
ncbi:MAG: 30S ribosomal protein S13 [Candidatus Colwellbacteria bacterium]|nr:30S ribosomal protein S13 [Candidatus Colwellbacteria bacterium]